jgi:flagellar biosynthesis protein
MRKNPPKSPKNHGQITRAVALKYQGTDLPTVVATGQNLIAQEIVRRADDAQIPLIEDQKLAKALAQLDLGAHIPEALFRAVAEVLSYALYVSGKHEDVLKRAEQTRATPAQPDKNTDKNNSVD